MRRRATPDRYDRERAYFMLALFALVTVAILGAAYYDTMY